MVEFYPATGIYWSPVHKQLADQKSNCKQLTAALLDIFFEREILAESNAKGGGSTGKKPLNATITDAIKG